MSNLNLPDITNYATAKAYHEKHGDHRIAYETYLRKERYSGVIIIKHYRTDIIRYYPDGRIEIRNNGYLTATTTNRLHQLTPRSVQISAAKGGSVTRPTGLLGCIPQDWTTVIEPTS